MILAAIELRRSGKLDELAIHVRADEALFARRVEQLTKFALATTDEGRENLDSGSDRPGEDGIGDLPGALPLDRSPAVRAVWGPDTSVEQTEIIVDFRDRADRRPRIVTGGLLFDGDRRRQAVDRVDVGLLHEPEELTGICREGLDVSALAFGVDRVEGQRRFSGSGQPGDHRQPVARNGHIDVAEVVLARATDY